MNNCKDCKWWSPILPEYPKGECRRHAPISAEHPFIPSEPGTPREYAKWPVSMDCDWCGDFERNL